MCGGASVCLALLLATLGDLVCAGALRARLLRPTVENEQVPGLPIVHFCLGLELPRVRHRRCADCEYAVVDHPR